MKEKDKNKLLEEYDSVISQRNQLRNVETEINRREMKEIENDARLSLYNEQNNRKQVVKKFQDEMKQDYNDR